MNDDDIVAPGKSFSNVKTMNHAYFVINDATCDQRQNANGLFFKVQIQYK